MNQRTVSFKEAIKRAFSNYANFKGRASRSEYWWFQLFYFIVSEALAMITYILGFAIMLINEPHYYDYDDILINYVFGPVMLVLILMTLAFLLPTLGLFWRRMHDIGRSGAWYFLSLIPIAGGIILLIWELRGSQPFTNKYGEVPNLVE